MSRAAHLDMALPYEWPCLRREIVCLEAMNELTLTLEQLSELYV